MQTRSAWLACTCACLCGSASARADVDRDVARARGLAWTKPVAIERVDAAELRTRVHAGGSDAERDAFALWGLRDDDRAVTINAIYDPASGAVAALPGVQDPALVPAIDRALIAQHVGSAAAPDGDARRAREALATGDAMALSIEVALAAAGKPLPWDDPELTAAIVDAARGSAADVAAFEQADGLAYVAALRRGRGKSWRAVDAAEHKPPTSTAQILHRDRRVAPVAVALAAAPPASLADAAVAQSDVWGELGVRAFLRAHGVADAVAREAAAGWTGDREVLCTRAGRSFGIWRIELDSDESAARAAAAIDRAIQSLAPDGATAAWSEQRGTSVIAAIRVPIELQPALAADAWALLAPATRTGTARAR